MNVNNLLIKPGHPNRPGDKLLSLDAVVVHYTANDRPGADDTANARYFGRPYMKNGEQYFEADGVTMFRYGSAHIVCDMDSATLCIPTDEVAWHCGDRQKQSDFSFGYRPEAKKIFNNQQNFRSVGVEICNNADWNAAVETSKTWISEFLLGNGLKINVPASLEPSTFTRKAAGEVLLLRHHDVTGKICPAPFVRDPQAWREYVEDIARRSS